MRVVRKCRRSSPCRAVGVDDDARARRRSVSLLVALVSFFFSFVSQRRFSNTCRLRFAVRRTFGGARHFKVGDRFSPARTRVCDSEIRHYRRSRNTNENRAPDRSFVFLRAVDDSKTRSRGQSSFPYGRLARTRRRPALCLGEEATRAPPRAQTTPRAEAHVRSTVARISRRVVLPRLGSIERVQTQPSPARRPAVRCGPRKTSRAATGGCGVIRVVRLHGRDAEGIVGRRAAQAGGAHVPPRAQGAPEEQEGHVR